jgi:glucose/arabinose dehydrogenase
MPLSIVRNRREETGCAPNPIARARAVAAAIALTFLACDKSPSGLPAQTDSDGDNTAEVETRLTVPAGMQATVFARDLPGARFMVLGPDGAVYVSQPESDQITRLIESGAGTVSSSVAVTGLNRPHGMAFHKGFLYIANTNGVVRVTLDANGKAMGTPEKVNSYSGGGGHYSRTIIFGADSGMYVSIGSSCNVCVESQADRATVMRYDEDGKNGRVYSKGLRNAVGLALHPVTKQIWAVQNERDNIEPDHEDLPPEELNILVDGGDFGWPYCWGDRKPSPEYNNATRCANTVPPALPMQAHSAPLGITFLTQASHLPSGQRGDALVAFHGSWNRDVPTGAKVVRVRVENNKPVGVEDFVTGWQRSNGSRWGRPVDVLVYKDGSLLVSDDLGGVITRISKK